MKQYTLIIDNVESGIVLFDDFDIETFDTLYGMETKRYRDLYLFLDGKIIYHIGNKKYIEVFDSCKKIYVDSF